MRTAADPISEPSGGIPARQLQLAAALALSVALHALVLLWFGPKPPSSGDSRKPQPLLAKLAVPQPPASRAMPPSAPPEIIAPEPVPIEPRKSGDPDEALPLLARARFAAAPDFRRLAMLDLPGEVRLKIRIYISALGKPERIDVLETRLVTAEFLTVVKEQVFAGTYLPARTQSGPVAGDFTMEIVGSPEPEETVRRLGPAGVSGAR